MKRIEFLHDGWLGRTAAFWRFFWQHFKESHCAHGASALSYTTLLALVPLLALSLALFSAFPAFEDLSDKFLNALFEHLVPAAEQTIVAHLRTFVAKAKALTGPGIIFLIITALMLMVTIENSLNEIWRAPPYRAISRRLIIYWAVLTLGPLLMGTGIVLTSQLVAMASLDGESATRFRLLRLLPWGLEGAAFTMLYLLVPNTRVRPRLALVGGFLSAALFEAAKMGFTYYITHFPTYEAVYGALAAIPLFLVWLYLSWLVALVGALFTYCLHVFRLHTGKMTSLAPEHDLLWAYQLLRLLWLGQQKGGLLDQAGLALRIPQLAPVQLDAILEKLRINGWVVRDEEGRWLLCRDPHLASLLDLYRSDAYVIPPPSRVSGGLETVLSRVNTAIHQSMAIPLAQLFVDEEEG